MSKKKATAPKPDQQLGALHLVALAIDAHQKEGTPEHAAAVKVCEEAKKIWRDQLRKKKCPRCAQELP